MKRILIFLLLFVVVFLTKPVTSESVTQPKVEKLNGKDVTVRVYKSLEDAPAAFEEVRVQLKGRSIEFDSIKSALDGEVDESAVVVVVGEDQKDEVVSKAIGDCIYAERYWRGLQFFLPGERQDYWWTFKDALGDVIAQATVEIFLESHKDSLVFIRQALLDESGRFKVPSVKGSLKRLYLIISHPDYGIAVLEPGYSLKESKTFLVPLVEIGTEADERSIWGVVVDPENNPVARALIVCSMLRPLGGGAVGSLPGWPYKVLTDKEGRFGLYLPIRKDISVGQMVPPKSKYNVDIKAPKGLGLLPYSGQVLNGEEVTITMQHVKVDDANEYFRTFVFEDREGRITEANRLVRISISAESQVESLRYFRYDDWKNGMMFPVGTFKAIMSGKKSYTFKAIEVTADSPEELVFKISDDILYYGQVVHGVSGEPIQGVFVIGVNGYDSRKKPYKITHQQWEAMHELPVNLLSDEQALEPLRQIYRFKKIVRTYEDGWFEMSFTPGPELDMFVILEEDYIGIVQSKRGLKPDKEGYAEVPTVKLFPSATVIVEPLAEGKDISISSGWHIDREDNPEWSNDLLHLQYGLWPERNLIRDRMLKSNKVQTFKIPAGVNLKISLHCHPKNKLNSIKIDRSINLKQGERIDLGSHSFGSMVEVFVKVVDSMGEPVEGVPVEKALSGRYGGFCHNTDANGIARFNVARYSKGEFVVQYYEDEEDPNRLHLREGISYEVGGEEDTNREFTITISDEIIEHFFE